MATLSNAGGREIQEPPKKRLAEKVGIGGWGAPFMLLFYAVAGGGLTAYYAPKKKLLFGIGGGIATIYLITYTVRAVDYKDYNPIPAWIRGRKKELKRLDQMNNGTN